LTPFSEIFASCINAAAIPPEARRPGDCRTTDRHLCTLCHASRLSYETESRLKELAVREFWSRNVNEGVLQPLIVSPMGRWYRAVSKRKAFPGRGGPVFGLIEVRQGEAARPLPVERCAIEPESHAAIYAACGELLRHPSIRVLSDTIKYIVIKGNYREQIVILNLEEIDGRMRHVANMFSKRLTKHLPTVTGVFLFEESGSDRYYLGSGNANRVPALVKIFGKPSVFLRIDGKSFLFHPVSFSQVNVSIIDTLVQAVRDLLPGEAQATLFDLYSGYGLFSLTMAPQWRRVVAAELSHEAVRSARENAARQHTANMTFHRMSITGESVLRLMAGSTMRDAVILDPPRNGVDPGVIDAIAAREPGRILHLFCNIDLMPGALEQWKRNGYRITHAVPVDNFPGTDEVELLVKLVPAQPAAS
jgi:tRNA/tmRNA/rRNA uracil-C5-methylase (TrmA/RlmC/RlmD family)